MGVGDIVWVPQTGLGCTQWNKARVDEVKGTGILVLSQTVTSNEKSKQHICHYHQIVVRTQEQHDNI